MKRALWLGLGAALGGAAPALAQEGEASGPLVVNGGLMIWTLIVFALQRALAMEKTRQEQEDLLERARREISAERERAIVELRREAVDVSLAAAAKLIGERLGSESDRKLVESYLATLEPGR